MPWTRVTISVKAGLMAGSGLMHASARERSSGGVDAGHLRR